MIYVHAEVVKNLNIVMADKKTTPELELQSAVELAKGYSSREREHVRLADEKPVSVLTEWIIFIRDICIILGVVIFLRTFVISPFTINGSSMESSYHSGEFILVDKISYSLSNWLKTEPARGDVVVIEPHTRNDRQYYIKRIIGMPGETLQIKE
jgi:signal peptidase I